MRRKIKERPDIMEKILFLAEHGKTTRQIASILQRKCGIEISHVTVSRLLKDVQVDRAAATKRIVQEHIQKTVPRDLELLDEIIAKMRKWLESKKFKINTKLLIIKELRQTIDVKLKYSGAGVAEQELTVKLYDFDTSGYPEPD